MASLAQELASLRNAQEKLEAEIASEYSNTGIRMEARQGHFGSVCGVRLVGRNDGDGSPQFDIIDAKIAAWIAQRLIKVFGLHVREYHGTWLVDTVDRT